MMSPRFSIIMPVYNAGAYFAGAVESVLSQSYPDFELILVDDGATDGSGQACDKFAAADQKVRVMHVPNGGICKARNIGIAAARGEYIMFCDHDDEYLPGYLAEVSKAIDEYDSPDIVKVNHETLRRWPTGDTAVEFSGSLVRTQVVNKGGTLKYSFFTDLVSGIWDGAYKRELILKQSLSFDESFKTGGEDIFFSLHAFSVAMRAIWLEKVLYRHYENMSLSTSSRCQPGLVNCYYRAIEYETTAWRTSDLSWAVARFRRWIIRLDKYVLDASGCDFSRFRKARIMSKFMRMLLPAASVWKGNASWCGVSDRVLLMFAALRLSWLFGLLRAFRPRRTRHVA